MNSPIRVVAFTLFGAVVGAGVVAGIGFARPDEVQMDEAEEEHHVAKLLIGELRAMKPGAPRYDAKFTVLAENVKHHIDEEESEMLPKAAELGAQRMSQLGAKMGARKLQLEAAMVRKAKPRAAATPSANGKRPATARPRTAARRTVAGTIKATSSKVAARTKNATRPKTVKKAVRTLATKTKTKSK